MLRRTIVIFFLGVFLSSCSLPYSAVKKKYQDAPVCCNSMSQFKFEALNVGNSKSFELNDGAEAFLFDSGKSYFKGFEIPQTGYPYYFLIESYMLGDTIRDAYIFIPYVLTLDKQYHIVRSTIPSDMRLRKAGMIETTRETGGLALKLECFLQFTGKNKNEKYVVVLTTKSLLQEKLVRSYRTLIPVILPGFVTILPGPKDVALIPAAPMGHLSVSLVSGFPKDFVIIDHREKSFTSFTIIPEEGIDKAKERFKDKKDIDVLPLKEFMNRSNEFITSHIIRNEYEGSEIDHIVLNYLLRHAGSTIGVTWNGGIAITYSDAIYAKSMHQKYINNPEGYEREKIQESLTDPNNPRRDLETHFGPIFQWK